MLAWCSDSRFAFVIAAEAVNQAAEALHTEFFAQPDPAFFIPDRTGIAAPLHEPALKIRLPLEMRNCRECGLHSLRALYLR